MATRPTIAEIWGHAATSSPDMQVPAYMDTGFPAPGGVPVKPLRGNVNWLHNYEMNGVRYLARAGISEWHASEDDYQPLDITRMSDGTTWQLVGTATIGLDPASDPTNWRRWPSPILSADFGDGSDGDVTVSATTTWANSRNASYNNLTIGASGLLVFPTPFMIRVRGRLTIASGGRIRFGHATAMEGEDHPGGVAQALGGSGMNQLSVGFLGGGSGGGAGGWDTVKNGANGGTVGTALDYMRFGGLGGNGEAGGSTAGSGGTGTAADLAVAELIQVIMAGGRGMRRANGSGPPTALPFIAMGGSGGGGGGGPAIVAPPSTAGGGGGGGAGGAVGLIVARECIVAANGAFYAPGGAGGDGNSYGGGGGGGGGWIGGVFGLLAGTTQTAAVCCPGGAGGTSGGGGANATSGANGRIDLFSLGY